MGALLLACRYAKLNLFLILVVSFAKTAESESQNLWRREGPLEHLTIVRESGADKKVDTT